jgi:hypothetical protein
MMHDEGTHVQNQYQPQLKESRGHGGIGNNFMVQPHARH